MRIENWCGYDIRFVEIDGEWWAILKDICDALKLRAKDVSLRIPPEYMERVLVPSVVRLPSSYSVEHKKVKNLTAGMIGKDISRKKVEAGSNDINFNEYNKTYWMLAVNELGIYEALFASRKLEARKFRMWAGTVMKKLRMHVGLEGYEVMRMTDPEIQSEIDDILDTLFWDDEKKVLMQSVTVQGGDVDQVPFE